MGWKMGALETSISWKAGDVGKREGGGVCVCVCVCSQPQEGVGEV